MKTTGFSAAEAPATGGSVARRRALEPYVEALRAWYSVQSQVAAPDCALVLNIGGEPFEIGAWERSQLELFFENSESPASREQMIGYALALATKCTMDLEHLARAGASADRYELEAHLMIDSDLGRGFLAELDRWIEESVGGGQARRATRLCPLRHRLARAVADVRRAIATSEGVGEPAVILESDEADQPLEAPVAAALPREGPRPAEAAVHAPRTGGPPPRLHKTPRRAAEPRARGRRGRTILLATLAVAWLASRLPGLLRAEAPVLTLAEIGANGPYFAVESRHPSLFVTVDDAGWSRLRDLERVERVELLSSMLRRRGFEGALLVTEDGRPAAQWLRGRGIELLP